MKPPYDDEDARYFKYGVLAVITMYLCLIAVCIWAVISLVEWVVTK